MNSTLMQFSGQKGQFGPFFRIVQIRKSCSTEIGPKHSGPIQVVMCLFVSMFLFQCLFVPLKPETNSLVFDHCRSYIRGDKWPLRYSFAMFFFVKYRENGTAHRQLKKSICTMILNRFPNLWLGFLFRFFVFGWIKYVCEFRHLAALLECTLCVQWQCFGQPLILSHWREMCTLISRRNNNINKFSQRPGRGRILCFDLLSLQYTKLTHELRTFLMYRFLGFLAQ